MAGIKLPQLPGTVENVLALEQFVTELLLVQLFTEDYYQLGGMGGKALPDFTYKLNLNDVGLSSLVHSGLVIKILLNRFPPGNVYMGLGSLLALPKILT